MQLVVCVNVANSMHLTVHSRWGDLDVPDVPDHCTVGQFCTIMWECFQSSMSNFPTPMKQQLVIDGERVRDDAAGMSLAAWGVQHGAQLVLIQKRDSVAPRHLLYGRRPELADVEVAIRADADRLGRSIEPGSPSQPARRGNAVEHHLQRLMQSLEGSGMEGAMLPEFLSEVLAGRDGAAGAGRVRVIGARPHPRRRAPLVVQQPTAEAIQLLQDMGFRATAARRALLLCRNSVEAAANWLLSNGDDDDADVEPTAAELSEAYGGQPVQIAQDGPQPEPDAADVQMLEAMGFATEAARRALQRFPDVHAAAEALATDPALSAPAVAPHSDDEGTRSNTNHGAYIEDGASGTSEVGAGVIEGRQRHGNGSNGAGTAQSADNTSNDGESEGMEQDEEEGVDGSGAVGDGFRHIISEMVRTVLHMDAANETERSLETLLDEVMPGMGGNVGMLAPGNGFGASEWLPAGGMATSGEGLGGGIEYWNRNNLGAIAGGMDMMLLPGEDDGDASSFEGDDSQYYDDDGEMHDDLSQGDYHELAEEDEEDAEEEQDDDHDDEDEDDDEAGNDDGWYEDLEDDEDEEENEGEDQPLVGHVEHNGDQTSTPVAEES